MLVLRRALAADPGFPLRAGGVGGGGENGLGERSVFSEICSQDPKIPKDSLIQI